MTICIQSNEIMKLDGSRIISNILNITLSKEQIEELLKGGIIDIEGKVKIKVGDK